MLSGYHVRVAAASAVVGYHGSFYADPATYDMERIEVRAEDLPLALQLASTTDKIDYAVTRIGDGDFLLPSQSELSMVALNGGEEHNQVKFSSCRQFSGESVVTFDEAPASQPGISSVPAREFDLPEGLDVPLVIAKDIDLRTAAVGDPVSARIDHDVKHKGAIILPKGALATGRITRLEKNESFTVLGVEFSDMEAPGIVAHMKGSLVNTVGFMALPRRTQVRLRTPALPGEGLIPMVPAQLRLSRGCIMFWRT
jgi:hypothetical protein